MVHCFQFAEMEKQLWVLTGIIARLCVSVSTILPCIHRRYVTGYITNRYLTNENPYLASASTSQSPVPSTSSIIVNSAANYTNIGRYPLNSTTDGEMLPYTWRQADF